MSGIFENLWVKLAAVILAFLLWFHVVTNKIYQDKITLHVTQVDTSSRLTLDEPPPDSVTVMVSATGKKLLQSDWKRSGVRLIVKNASPGKFKIDVTPDNLVFVSADKVDLTDVISPREIELNLDRRAEKRVPVKSRLVVVPADGFAAGASDSVSPPVVTVSGPATQLAELTQIETNQDVLRGARSDYRMKVPLKKPDIYDLELRPDSVTVFTDITPIKVRLFSGITVHLINVPRGKNIAVVPDGVDIRAGARAQLIDSFTASKISVVADYAQADRNGKIELKVTMPPSVSLLYKSADSVTIVEK